MGHYISDRATLEAKISDVVRQSPITDVHTHLYPPKFGELMASGIDDLLNYHYLIAETLLRGDITKERFWELKGHEQADYIWQRLFVDERPISEATRGVVTTLKELGLDVREGKLSDFRDCFEGTSRSELVDSTFKLANVSDVVMTNDPLDDLEAAKWITDSRGELASDRRFHRALRLDPILNDWKNSAAKLRGRGYEVADDLTDETSRQKSISELSRFLTSWIHRLDPIYLAASLPAAFSYPVGDTTTTILNGVVLPIARQFDLAIAIMAGTRRQINPDLRLAGDSVASSDVTAIESLCRMNPDNRFLVTLLSREDQHRLTVVARKFSNMMIFGCWWFLNTPSLIEEITTMRVELLGFNFIPQHSDARVLEQLIYKWSHSRKVIAKVLFEEYNKLIEAGWGVSHDDIANDVARLLRGNFWKFVNRRVSGS